MNKTTDVKNLKPAKRYAQALLEIGNITEIIAELENVQNILCENTELKDFLEHPIISVTDKKDVVKQIFEGKINNHILNFLYVLLDEGRISIFDTILQCVKEENSAREGIVRATVTSVIEIGKEEKNRLQKVLEEKLHAKIELNYEYDNSLIGGFSVNVQDRIIDLSLKSKFEQLKKLNKG